MLEDELFEEIRTLLREAQQGTVAKPWNYTDVDLVVQVRSAFRYLRAVGYMVNNVPFPTTMDQNGEMVGPLTDTEGVFTAHFVAARLISGDLLQKLLDGELGVSYKSGTDEINTNAAAKAFQDIAKDFREQFQTFMTIALTNSQDTTYSVFGDQVAYADLFQGDE